MNLDAAPRIGEWLKHFGPASTATICEALHLARGKARATLERMRESGLVDKLPGNGKAMWQTAREEDHRLSP